jgi:O-antigen/teichoic acid export membrane protein
MPLSWSHEQIELDYVHVFLALLMALLSSCLGDAFLYTFCARMGLIHIRFIASLLLPFSSSSNFRGPFRGLGKGEFFGRVHVVARVSYEGALLE